MNKTNNKTAGNNQQLTKILIVEDENIIAEDIQYVLKSSKYGVTTVVSSGEEAILKAGEIRPDLVLMDIVLEGKIDGIQAAEKIRNLYNIPIVYLTAHADKNTLQRAKITEPFGYIIKPFEDQDLNTTIEIALYKHRMDMKLRESEENYRNVTESATDAIITIDERSNISFVNQATIKIFGYAISEIIGKPLSLLIPQLHRHNHNATLKKFLAAGKKKATWEATELNGRHKNGTKIPIEISLSETIQDGKHFFTGIIRDISERKRTEKALKESKNFLRTLLDSIQTGILAIDAESKTIVDVNSIAIELIGAPKEQIIGSKCHEYLCISETSRCPITASPQTVETSEGELRKVSGEKIPVIKNVVSAIMDGRKHLIESFIDITEQKHTEIELQESNAVKELLIDVITHDLKNPVNVINNMMNIMDIEYPGNEIVETVKTCSDNLLNVIENATTLAKVTIGEDITKKELDLNKIILEAVSEFTALLKNEQISLENNFSESIIVKANPIITQIFRNYISNAINHASQGKKIIIDAKKENETILVSVKDFGATIQKKDRERIFTRRAQLENGKKRGRGLGLAIVKKIAEAHRGLVWVEPNKPTGNIFYVRIPE